MRAHSNCTKTTGSTRLYLQKRAQHGTSMECVSLLGSGGSIHYWSMHYLDDDSCLDTTSQIWPPTAAQKDWVSHMCYAHRDHSVYVTSQWETTLQCNVAFHWLGAYTKCSVVSHWLGACTKWSLYRVCLLFPAALTAHLINLMHDLVVIFSCVELMNKSLVGWYHILPVKMRVMQSWFWPNSTRCGNCGTIKRSLILANTHTLF